MGKVKAKTENTEMAGAMSKLVQRLLDSLEFSPENVLEESAKQPKLFQEAISFRLFCLRTVTAAKGRRDRLRAKKALRLRQSAREDGERMTEGNLEELLLRDKEMQEIVYAVEQAEEAEEHSKLLLEAFRMRRDSLRNIGELVSSGLGLQNFITRDQEKLEKVRADLKTKYKGNR